MQNVLFYLFAVLTLGCGVLVLISSSPVTSAMFLVLTLGALAGLLVLLHAYFLAAIQILVYAGAVMVLFLFVIMLLDLKTEERRRIRKFVLLAGLLCVGAIAGIFLGALRQTALGAQASPSVVGDTMALGRLLFTQYLLPFEIVSVLLLVAMVGVVLLSKKVLK